MKMMSSIRDFFAEIKSLLYELKNSFSLDILEEGAPGNPYFSHHLASQICLQGKEEDN